MPVFKDYQTIVCHIDSSVKQSRIMMIPITEEEEQILDKHIVLEKHCGQLTFNIKPNDVQFYGEIDFSDVSEDLDQIDKAKWFTLLDNDSVHIPSDYDYNTHCCYSPITSYRWTETFVPSLLVRYKHACLGKPSRVVIFKYTHYVAR